MFRKFGIKRFLVEQLKIILLLLLLLLSIIDNIWGADLAYMQVISKFDKGVRFLLRVINIFSKYAWVIPLKDKKGITITNASQKILRESNHEPKKIWVDK